MGILDTERELMEELKAIQNDEVKEETPTEEVLEEANEELAELGNQGSEELEEPQEEEVMDDLDEDDSEEEEPEEELTGAKFRHKLKEEKQKREALEARLREIELANARAEGARNATPRAEEPVEEIPDREYEPEKYAIWKADQLEKKTQELEKFQAKVAAERQWEVMQNEYSRKKPEYQDAKQFLLDQEAAKVKATYPNATESQIAQHLKEQEYVTVAQAANAGIDPLQHVEFLAFQAGFRPGEKVESTNKPLKKKSNIKNIKKNAKKNASLIGGSSAGETSESKTAEQLVAMSMDEIMQFGVDKYEKEINKLQTRMSNG